MTISIILDIMVIALLLVASFYGWTLSRKLRTLANAQAEFKDALAHFDQSTTTANDTLRKLEASGVARGAELQASATRAQALANELSVMMAAGERIADRIEAAVGDVKALGAAAARKPRRAA